MYKMILILSALLLSQVTSAMTNDEFIHPRVNGLSGVEVLHTHDVLVQTQRQQLLTDMKQSLRSTLIIDFRPAFAVSRPDSGIDNSQF